MAFQKQFKIDEITFVVTLEINEDGYEVCVERFRGNGDAVRLRSHYSSQPAVPEQEARDAADAIAASVVGSTLYPAVRSADWVSTSRQKENRNGNKS